MLRASGGSEVASGGLLMSSIVLVICGAGESLSDLWDRARDLPNVLLPGRVGQPEIWELMQRSTAGLAPYRALRNFDDNLPNKPIEYMSAGLPIIASDVRVLSRLIDEHSCGLTYAHGSAEALAQAITTMARDPSLRASLAGSSAKLFAERFVAERVYDKMAAHLETVGSRRA